MPVPTTFLDTCRSAASALPELAAFRAAGALSAEATRADAVAQWSALYATDATGQSLASRLRQAIRNVINAEADKAAASAGTIVTTGEREACFATLVPEYAPVQSKPPSGDDEYAEYTRLLKEDYLS